MKEKKLNVISASLILASIVFLYVLYFVHVCSIVYFDYAMELALQSFITVMIFVVVPFVLMLINLFKNKKSILTVIAGFAFIPLGIFGLIDAIGSSYYFEYGFTYGLFDITKYLAAIGAILFAVAAFFIKGDKNLKLASTLMMVGSFMIPFYFNFSSGMSSFYGSLVLEFIVMIITYGLLAAGLFLFSKWIKNTPYSARPAKVKEQVSVQDKVDDSYLPSEGIHWDCPKCGNINSKDGNYCLKCGSPRPVQKPAVDRRYCVSCGNPLVQGAAFCNKCGKKV